MSATNLSAAPAPAARRLPHVLRLNRDPAKTVVNKIGFLGALLRPIGLAIAVVLVGCVTIFAWNVYSASEHRRGLHQAAVPTTGTIVETTVQRQVADGEVEMVVRQVDGSAVRVIAAKNEVARLVNRMLIELDAARRQAHHQASAELDGVFVDAFASRGEDLDRYADWYFAWGRSWRLLYEALIGAGQEATRMGFSRTQVSDAARFAVEDYLLRHYREMVLKPALRDPIVSDGIVSVFRDANTRFMATAAVVDEQVRSFMRDEAHFSEPLDPGAIRLHIDWDAERWRAPREGASDRYLEPARTAVVVAGGVFLLGPVIDRLLARSFARVTAPVLASARMTVSGAAVGSVEPGLGTAIGAIGGLALDWGMNALHEWMSRDDFIGDNAAALDATIAAWKSRVMPEVSRNIDVWFDDARAQLMHLTAG